MKKKTFSSGYGIYTLNVGWWQSGFSAYLINKAYFYTTKKPSKCIHIAIAPPIPDILLKTDEDKIAM